MDKFRDSTLLLSSILAGAMLSIFVLPGNAAALTLSPPTYEIGASPGQTLTTGLKIFNETDKAGTFYFETQNFFAKGDSGEPQFVEEEQKTDLASWIEAPASIDLNPGELKKIDFVIHVPENADPGGHYAALFLSTTPTNSEGGAVGISSKIGTLILLRVEGNIVEQGKLASFAVDARNGFYDRLPVTFATKIDNIGTVYIKPSGKITVYNIFGQKSAETTVNIGRMPDGTYKPVGNVLSNSSRKYESAWKKTEDQKSGGNFFEQLRLEMNNFALGPYTAKLALTYGVNNDKKLNGSVGFWVIPWRLLLVASIILAVVLAIMIYGIKSYNRWIIRQVRRSIEKERKK